MKTIVAPSYQTLIFALEEFNIENIHVITRNKSIKLFSEKIGIKLTFINEEEDLSFRGLLNYKSLIIKSIENIENNQIYYCFYLSVLDYFIVKTLAKKNKIFFLNRDPIFKRLNFSCIVNKNYQKRALNKLIYFLIFNINSQIFYGDNRYFLGIMKTIGQKPIFNSEKIQVNSKKIMEKLSIKKHDFIYVDNLKPGQKVDFKKLTKILKLINEKYSLAVKPHPRENFYDFCGFNTIPSEIPSEMLHLITNKAIIGLSSISLKALSKNIKTISLINMLNNLNKDWRNEYTKFLINEKILIPTDTKELQNILD